MTVVTVRSASTARRHRIGPYRALGHVFAVESDHAAVTSWLASLFAAFPAAPGPVPTYVVERSATDGAVRLRFDDEVVVTSSDPAHAVAMLLWDVNRRVVASSAHLVRIHAAGVAREGVAVVLPAPQESGKTTLAAGLVRRGLDYLSDEVVAIDPATGEAHAYPKALSVDAGSHGVLAALRPSLPAALGGWAPTQWQVPPASIRAGCVVPRARPLLLVTPRYVPRAETSLHPLSRADALLAVADCTFDLATNGRRDVLALGRLVAGADCYRLTVGDLDEACALVEGLVDVRIRTGGISA